MSRQRQKKDLVLLEREGISSQAICAIEKLTNFSSNRRHGEKVK